MRCFFPFKNKSKSKLPPNLLNKKGRPNEWSANSGSMAKSVEEMYREKEHNLRVFSFQELREATYNFSRTLKIGEGGFGKVYKGTISDVNGKGDETTLIAIKKLNKQGNQGYKQWLAEVQFLGIVDHPNLVKLLGYCYEDGERGTQHLLVYQYMPNKSLEDHLFSRATPTLPWKTRLEIMLGAAQGLDYLHEGLEVQVIFRDFKASNVLLDTDFKPKLSDFGLAREGPNGDHTHVSTAVVGTYGYAAPEYLDTGHLTNKSDIYSFGVVLYEIITGRRTVDRNRPSMEQKLLEWVKQYPVDGKKFSSIIDPEIRNQCSIGSAKKIAKLADSCLSKNQNSRPTMAQIVDILKEAIEESNEVLSNGNK